MLPICFQHSVFTTVITPKMNSFPFLYELCLCPYKYVSKTVMSNKNPSFKSKKWNYHLYNIISYII